MEKLLSVVLPTVNRRDYLEITLNHLLPQLERNMCDIEFIICNNASKDDTDRYIKELMKNKPYIKYKFYNEFLQICDSLSRSIGNATGKYVILWGDDDIPAPYCIDNIIATLKANPQLGIINYNVLVGTDRRYSMDNIRVDIAEYNQEIELMNLDKFLIRHAIPCGFITSMVFLRDAWYNGLSFHDPEHYGYEFLGIIFSGLKGFECAYLNFPLVIRRNPLVRTWLKDWPKYALIGIPKLLKDLEAAGLTTNAYQSWLKNECTFLWFIKVLLMASSYKKEYRGLCSKMAESQTSSFRKILVYFIVNLSPAFINNSLRKMAYK